MTGCICYPTPIEQHYVYYGITEPGSALQPCYTCPVHFPEWTMPNPSVLGPDDADYNARLLLDLAFGDPLDPEDLEMLANSDPPEPWPISGDELRLLRDSAKRWNADDMHVWLEAHGR